MIKFYNIEIYFMLFIIYAVLGWIMECSLGLIQKHKFVNRGFLIGPYCPIYGVGVVGVSILLSRFSNNIILLFLLSTCLCGALEYFTSYIMEKIFHARWWDYSDNKFNINGRICLETLIPFGIISVLVICYANPWIISNLYKIPTNILNYLCLSLFLIYVIDSFISFKVIIKFKNLNNEAKDNTEEISKKVKETAEAAIEKLTKEKEKLISKMNIRNYSMMKNMKYTRKNYTTKIRNTRVTLIGTFKTRIFNIDEKIKKSAKDMTDKIKQIKENQLKIRSEIRERFIKESKLNKRLISAFPNVEHKDYIRKKKNK